jgi:hypothetical protein
MWKPAGGTIVISPFEKPIPRSERPGIEEEAYRLLKLLAPGEKHRVQFDAVKS